MQIRIILGFFVVSLFIRLGALWIFPEPHLGTNAEIAYVGGAHLIVEGEGFRDPSYPVFTPPLYAIFIAVSLYLFGDDQIPVKIAQAFADSLTVVIVYFIAKHIFGRKTAFLTGVVLSIYPFLIYPVTYIGTETFFTLFLSIFVLLNAFALVKLYPDTLRCRNSEFTGTRCFRASLAQSDFDEVMEVQWSNLVLVPLPIHPRRLNQTELFFSVLVRKVRTPDDSGCLEELHHRILRF